MGKRAPDGVLEFGQGFLDFQRTPKFAQGGGQLRAVRAKLAVAGKALP